MILPDNAAALPDGFLASDRELWRATTARRTLIPVDNCRSFLRPTFIRCNKRHSRILAAAVVDLLGSARARDLLLGQSGSDPLALIHGSVLVDAFEEIRFPIARDLELRDDLLAEARSTDEHGDLAHALSRRRGNSEGVLHRSTIVVLQKDLLYQQCVYEVARLNLVRT